MKNSRVTIIILFGVLGGILLLYFALTNSDEKRYQWYESYKADNKQPYGVFFIKEILKGYRPNGNFTYNDKKPLTDLLSTDTVDTKSDYIFIGQSAYLSRNDVGALVKFMEAGNDAFISCLEPPETLMSSVYFKECNAYFSFEYNKANSVSLNFYHDSLRTNQGVEYAYRYGTDDHPYAWNFVTHAVFCDSTKSIVPIGYQEVDNVNFVKIPVGKGNLYLHSNPIVFTNYFLTKEEKLAYAEKVFSHLNGNNIIWDEYSKISFLNNDNPYNSPLYYILQQPSLKYAWWLLLLTVLLYVFLYAKRRQRIIPVLEPKTNTSLEYVNLISTLYYQNGDHLDMVKKKMKYFLYFIRSKYGIHAETFKPEHISKLAEKAKVNHTEVQSIFDQYHFIEKRIHQNLEVNRLLDLFNSIERFYKNCK